MYKKISLLLIAFILIIPFNAEAKLKWKAYEKVFSVPATGTTKYCLFKATKDIYLKKIVTATTGSSASCGCDCTNDPAVTWTLKNSNDISSTGTTVFSATTNGYGTARVDNNVGNISNNTYLWITLDSKLATVTEFDIEIFYI